MWEVGGISRQLLKCPLCDASLVGVEHLLSDCPALTWLRERSVPASEDSATSWALQGAPHVDALKQKVIFVGISLVRAALTRMIARS